MKQNHKNKTKAQNSKTKHKKSEVKQQKQNNLTKQF